MLRLHGYDADVPIAGFVASQLLLAIKKLLLAVLSGYLPLFGEKR